MILGDLCFGTLRHQNAKTPSINTKLSEREEWLAKQIVDAAYSIHKALGPGLLESIYVTCFCYEMEKRNIFFERHKAIAIEYQTLVVEKAHFIDLVVEDSIIIEFKAQENYHPVWMAQLLSYLRLSKKRLGFLINFHVPIIKNGINRYII